MGKFLFWAGVIFLVVLGIDQGTKLWVDANFVYGESVEVLPVFNLTYVRNQGAAWGMFAGAQLWLAAFGVLSILLCALFWKKLFGPQPKMLLLGALLLSGIVGNIIDRLRLNYVIDFFDFHLGEHHFPVFNIADSAICVSVFLIILVQWFEDRKKQKADSNQ